VDRVLVLEEDGALLGSEDDARDLIQQTFGTSIDTVAVPTARLDPGFFELRTGVAGEFVQKLAQYRLRLAVVGDVTEQVAASDAFRDWVREVNRGQDVWFIDSMDGLSARLEAAPPRR
jgi:hypothetical protein